MCLITTYNASIDGNRVHRLTFVTLNAIVSSHFFNTELSKSAICDH